MLCTVVWIDLMPETGLPFKSGSVQHKALPVPLAGYSGKPKTMLNCCGIVAYNIVKPSLFPNPFSKILKSVEI